MRPPRRRIPPPPAPTVRRVATTAAPGTPMQPLRQILNSLTAAPARGGALRTGVALLALFSTPGPAGAQPARHAAPRRAPARRHTARRRVPRRRPARPAPTPAPARDPDVISTGAE